MPWFGQIAGEEGPGVMAILETRDDAGIRLGRLAAGESSTLCAWPHWELSRGAFQYARAVRYVLFERGGYR